MWLAVVVVAGCAAVGPNTVIEDRRDYTQAMATSLEEQLLLNVVRARYLDTPSFLSVNSIVGSYELSRSVSLDGSWFPLNDGDKLGIGGDAKLSDRPTVSYSPLTGDAFAQAVMSPIPLPAVLTLIQEGWAADETLFTLVRSVNGNLNRLPRMTSALPAEPEFIELAKVLRSLQDKAVIDFRVQSESSDKPSVFIVIRPERGSRAAADYARLKQLLKLDPNTREVSIRFGLLPRNDEELAISTYSLMQVLLDQARGVEVPAEHRAAGMVTPDLPPDSFGRIQIHSAKERPADAAIAVFHRGYWFYLAANDLPSKGRLMAISLIYQVLKSGTGGGPVLTIPTF